GNRDPRRAGAVQLPGPAAGLTALRSLSRTREPTPTGQPQPREADPRPKLGRPGWSRADARRRGPRPPATAGAGGHALAIPASLASLRHSGRPAGRPRGVLSVLPFGLPVDRPDLPAVVHGDRPLVASRYPDR